METPYGPPTAPITIGTVGERRVAFLPRHGKDHEFPPHLVPYRANVWALKELGVTRVFGPCAAGPSRDIPPGTSSSATRRRLHEAAAEHVLRRAGDHAHVLRRPVLPDPARGARLEGRRRRASSTATAARWS